MSIESPRGKSADIKSTVDDYFRSINPESIFFPDQAKLKLKTLTTRVELETNNDRKKKFGLELAKYVTTERADCIAMSSAIILACDIIANAGGKGKEVGFEILASINDYISEGGYILKALPSDDMRTRDDLDQFWRQYNRRGIIINNNPAVKYAIAQNSAIALFNHGVSSAVSKAKEREELHEGLIPIFDPSFMTRDHKGVPKLNKDGDQLFKVQNELLVVSNKRFFEVTDEIRIQYPSEVFHLLKNGVPFSTSKFDAPWTRKFNGISMKDMYEQKDVETFNKQALLFMAGITKGDQFWLKVVDTAFLISPKKTLEKRMKTKEIDDIDLTMRIQALNGLIALNVLGPALKKREVDEDFDWVFDSIMETNLNRRYLNAFVTSLFFNYLGSNGLNGIDSPDSKFLPIKNELQSVFGNRMEEYKSDPNKILKEFRETVIPNLADNLSTRFPNAKWLKELIYEFEYNLPKGEIPKNWNERAKEVFPGFECSEIDADAKTNYLWRKLKKEMDINSEKINSEFVNKVCEFNESTVTPLNITNASLIMTTDAEGVQKIHYNYVLPPVTPILSYENYGSLNLTTGDIEPWENEAPIYPPNVRAAVRFYTVLLTYSVLQENGMINRIPIGEILLDSCHLPNKMLSLDYSSEETDIQILEMFALTERTNGRKITMANLSAGEQEDVFLRTLKKYPGGIQALRRNVEEYMPKTVEQDTRTRLQGLLEVLKELQ